MPYRPWLALATVALLIPAASAQLVRSGSGAAAGDIQAAVDQYRADLGTLNPNTAGSAGSGRREINWDGVPDARSAPNDLPANFFNVNSPRGVVFDTPGTGFQVSANAGVNPVEFGTIDPSYSDDFAAFSAQKLFTPIGSNITDVRFFVPGSSDAAGTRGFGAVFSDVDAPNTTSIAYFDLEGNLLGTYFAPGALGDAGFSFLGVSFADPVVGRVRITTGNAALGAGVTDQNGDLRDLVVMDDFIYGEPTGGNAIPEPGTLALLLAGGAAAAWKRRRS